MNQYERAVLTAVAEGPASVGWYKIEQRLTEMLLDSREYLPETLKRLVEQGLIEEDSKCPGKYTVTAHGCLALETKN